MNLVIQSCNSNFNQCRDNLCKLNFHSIPMTIKHASQYWNVKEYLGISKLPNHQIRQKLKENMGHESTVLSLS